MVKKEIMSSDRYVNNLGLICPVCGSEDISFDADAPELDGSMIFVNINCHNPECKATWTDVFKLTGYDNLTDKDGKVIKRPD